MSKLVNYIPALVGLALAIVCYLLLDRVGPKGGAGLAFIAGALVGWAFPQLQKASATPVDVVPINRDKQAGHALPGRVFVVLLALAVAAAALVVALMYSRDAHADELPAPTAVTVPQTDTVGNWTEALSLGTGLGLNLKDGSVQVGALLGSCFNLTNTKWHAGVSGCVNLRLASKDLANAYGGSLAGHYRNSGLGFGLLKEQGVPGWPTPMLYLLGQAALLGGY